MNAAETAPSTLNSWWLKGFLIGALMLVLAIPLVILRSLVGERQARAAEAVDEIARSSSRPQKLTGPFLVVEEELTYRNLESTSDGGGQRTVTKDHVRARHTLVAPEVLKMEGSLKSEVRRRGLFSATLYHASLTAQARLAVPAPPALTRELVAYRVTSVRLEIGLGDTRGVERLDVRIGGRELRVEPGSVLPWLGEAVHVSLPPELWQPAALDCDLTLDLTGTESLAVVPLGGDNDVALRSDWPHPAFGGNYLPVAHEIAADGFRANWKVSRLASQAGQRLSECGGSAACPALDNAAFVVRFVDPVDRYLKTDRAMKYSMVFLVLVFGAVFFIEALRRVSVHPMQYVLTGFAVAIFFLLLLSLAEHLGFGLAYMVAAAGCVLLIASYMTAVLGTRGAGLGFGAFLAALYGLLYGVLQSEDYALLMGTLTLFGFLAFIMIATRRLNWSRMGRG
jgi:inner membrane protein